VGTVIVDENAKDSCAQLRDRELDAAMRVVRDEVLVDVAAMEARDPSPTLIVGESGLEHDPAAAPGGYLVCRACDQHPERRRREIGDEGDDV
jgi:hypothetical protein